MGEIADAMLDGTLCEGCGVYLDDEGGSGFPRYCSKECAEGRGVFECDSPQPPRKNNRGINASPKAVKCRHCTKRFWTQASAWQHELAKHGGAPKREAGKAS